MSNTVSQDKVSAQDTTTGRFTPSRIVPPPLPLPLWRFFPQFVVNPLRVIPEPVYHLPAYAPPQRSRRMAWVTAPDLVERVLLRDQDKFRKTDVERRIFDPMIGGGILTAHGQEWRWQRRTLAPVFRPSALKCQVPQISEAGDAMVARWRTAGDGTRDIERDMTDVTFDALTRTIFAGANDAEQEILKTDTGRYLDGSSWEVAYEIFGVRAGTWHPWRHRMQDAAGRLRGAAEAIVARERTCDWASGGLGAALGAARDPETGAAMSDAVIAANLATFAAAGHETTAKALTWALYLLAKAPDWQARVRAEVAEITGDRAVSADDVDRLVITRQVLNEAMRLFPPAPVMTRQTVEPITLGDVALDAGAIVVIPIFVIHRHRALWSEPDVFDPNRFQPDRAQTYARTQFMPFGYGPRICIGMSFAVIEAVVLLATLVRANFFSADAALAPEPLSRVTLRPRGGMPLRVDTQKTLM